MKEKRKNKKEIVSMDFERAEKIKKVLQYLYEINKFVPIIVEGKKDKKALRELGFDGEIITLHSGKSIYEFSETVAHRYEKIVLLIDWDEKGQELYKKICENLHGMWEDFASIREVLKMLCQKEVSEIDEIPKLFHRIAGNPLDVRQWTQ